MKPWTYLRAPYSLQVALQADVLATLLLKLSPGGLLSFLLGKCVLFGLRRGRPFSVHTVVRAASTLSLSSGPDFYIFCLGGVVFQKMGAIKKLEGINVRIPSHLD